MCQLPLHFSFIRFLFAMAIDHDKTWVGYLTAHIIDRCMEHSMPECLGCIDGILSPLLHRHNNFTLRSKVDCYLPTVLKNMDVSSIFDDFVVRFGFFSLNREKFVDSGKFFLKTATPTSVVFGDYITPSLDFALYGEFSYQEPTVYNPTSPELVKEPTRRKNSNQDAAAGSAKKRKKAIKHKNSEDQVISQNVVLGDGSSPLATHET